MFGKYPDRIYQAFFCSIMDLLIFVKSLADTFIFPFVNMIHLPYFYEKNYGFRYIIEKNISY